MPWDLTSVVQAAQIAAAIVAFLTLVKGVIEYTRGNALKRAEHFSDLRRQLKDSEVFQDICLKLETDDVGLIDLSFASKRDFLGLFEQVAMSLNSGLLRREVAHYMFGYYAIRCDESKNFWSNVAKDSPYWSLFINFAKSMKIEESKFPLAPSRYQF
jgi:hypothetical protein